MKRIRTRTQWRAPRPRGWRNAGTRTTREINAAILAHMAKLWRGETPTTSVTRRWPT